MKSFFKIGLLCLLALIVAAQLYILTNLKSDTGNPPAAETTAPEITGAPLLPALDKIPEPEPEPEPDGPGPAEPVFVDVPVLMYHTSSENSPGALTELYVKPSEFEKQIKYLAENGFAFCTFDDYDDLNNIVKPVFVTFDDGYRENYTEIFPILQKYNAKITLFLTMASVKDSELARGMITEMSGSGLVKFESHTVKHPDLTAFGANTEGLESELENSKTQIEELTGKPVTALAYPAGKFDGAVKEAAKGYYSFGVSIVPGMHNTGSDPFEIRRFRINRGTSLETFIKYVN